MNQLVLDKWHYNYKNLPNEKAIIHVSFDRTFEYTFKSLFESAVIIAINLKNKGLKKGDICGIMMKHNHQFYPIYLGISLIGAVPSVLAYQNPKLHIEKFNKGLVGIAKHSGINYIITDLEMKNSISVVINNVIESTIKEIFATNEIFKNEIEVNYNFDIEINNLLNDWKDISSNDPFLLQHSSGTTGIQKGIVLSHNLILKHAENYSFSINMNIEDKIVSWLPLYHDMGLIAAFTIPLIIGATTIHIDPFDFIAEPAFFIETIDKFKGTLTWMPNFAYLVLANKIRKEDIINLDLSSMRMFINCSEPVTHIAHNEFVKFYKENGVSESKLGASYAMAETTFAVTQTPLGESSKILNLDKNELAQGKVLEIDINQEVNNRTCVSSGIPIKGCEIKIVSESGEALGEGLIGELLIKSVSMFNGYENNLEQTSAVLKNGWYLSGDLGFYYCGQYYIIGRKKDLIIIAGKNIYPEDVENIVNSCEGVIPGRVVAFGIYNSIIGTEQLHIVAETKLDEADYSNLKNSILQKALINEISISGIHIKPPKWLFKSSSGKLSRNDNKNRIIEELNL